MKVSILLLALLFALAPASFPQTGDTYDIATFTPPSGWKKQTKEGVVLFTTADERKGAFAMLTVYASGPSSGDPKRDFESDWQEFIAGQLKVTGRPEIETAKTAGGWNSITGAVQFVSDLGSSIVVLNTFSGFGRSFSLAAVFNDQGYLPAIEAFVSSIKLKKTEPENHQPQTADNRSGSQPSVTQFFWKQSQNRRDIGGYAGYSRNTYQFNANGTYQFSRVDFQNFAPKYYLENEEGTYKVTGNTITVTPRKAFFSSHKSKKEDPPLRSGNLGLAVVQYRFEFMDLHNDGRWSLLLSPVDGIETKRDGGFSFYLNGERRKTYSYSAVNEKGELVP